VNNALRFGTLFSNPFLQSASNPVTEIISHLNSYRSSMTINEPDTPLTLSRCCEMQLTCHNEMYLQMTLAQCQ